MGKDYVYLSKEGYERLKSELHQLRTVKRPQIVGEIKRARELGDISENAEYHAAKEAQSHIERKIAELEYQLSRAQIVSEAARDVGTVTLLSSVHLRDLEDDEEITFRLVSEAEADPAQARISVQSPVGRALLGHRVGDKVMVQTPGGDVAYEILRISSEGDTGA